MLSWHSDLRRQLEEIAEQRSVDAQQAQRELELSNRYLANAQQQLQFKADIIHQLTGGLQVLPLPCPFTPSYTPNAYVSMCGKRQEQLHLQTRPTSCKFATSRPQSTRHSRAPDTLWPALWTVAHEHLSMHVTRDDLPFAVPCLHGMCTFLALVHLY